jgi:hypothetical protein
VLWTPLRPACFHAPVIPDFKDAEDDEMIEEVKGTYSPKRTVIGFDIRKSSSLNNLFMTSYDDDVRYEDIYDSFRKYQSGINLFFADPASIASLKMPADALIIAFDLPTELVDRLSAGNVSNPQPLPDINIHDGWGFVGFDVVDPLTQTSAFHGFDLPFSLDQLIKEYSLVFNEYGLLTDITIALKVTQIYDNLIPEHAPFSPCGIWLKQTNSAVKKTA